MGLSATADTTGSDIAAALADLPRGEEQSEAAWKLICEKLATWITTNAVVAVASVTGVTAGGASSGPGTGTIS